MASTLQSPGVQIVEKDVSAVTTALSTSTGGTVGVFQWGPVMTPMLIDNESALVSTFGKPDTLTYSSFFSAANFLSYSNSLWVTRAATTNTNATSSGTGLLIKNLDEYETSYADGGATVGTWAARYPGTLGNGITVSMADSSTFATWEYASEFQSAPDTSDDVAAKGGSNDELHVIVIDKLGKFTGTVNGVMEKYAFVSKAADARNVSNSSNYYPNVIRNQSSFIYWMDHPVSGWGVDAGGVAFPSLKFEKTITGASTSGLTGVSILTATWATGTATLTFAETIAATVGSKITVTGVTGYNVVDAIVTASTTTSVSYAIATNPGVGVVDEFSLLNGTQTATITFASTTSGVPLVGSSVVISGITPTGYNSTNAIVTGATTTSLSYVVATTLATVTPSGGAEKVTNLFGTALINGVGSNLAGAEDDNQPTDGELQLAWNLYHMLLLPHSLL
jgi:hypothetical protein